MSIAYKINGKRVTKRKWDARKGVGMDFSAPCMGTKTYSESNPMDTQFDGVMESQVGEMRRVIKEESIQGVKVRNDGTFHITSRRGRARLLRLRQMHDKQGGYGDG